GPGRLRDGVTRPSRAGPRARPDGRVRRGTARARGSGGVATTSVERVAAYAAATAPPRRPRYGVQPDGIVGAASLMKSAGVGAFGGCRSSMLASTRSLSPLRRLHGAHAVTTFSQIDSPPRLRGMTWSSVRRPLVV